MNKWNRIPYGGPENGLTAEDFYERWDIQSAPLFPNACWFDCPGPWVEDVSQMLDELTTLNIRVAQVKEKFSELRVYIDQVFDENGEPTEPDDYDKAQEIIAACIQRLRDKKLHP